MDTLSLLPLSLDNGTAPATMSSFPKLPIELRQIIWILVAMEPEIISVRVPQMFRESILQSNPVVLITTRSKSEDMSRNPVRSANSCRTMRPKPNSTSPTKQDPAHATMKETLSHSLVFEVPTGSPEQLISNSDHTKSSFSTRAATSSSIPLLTSSSSLTRPRSTLITCGNG